MDSLEQHAEHGDYEKIHDICQTMYGMKHLSERLEGLYLVRNDEEVATLYYQVFIGVLELGLFSLEKIKGDVGNDA